jgi:hypothetical protein
MLTRACWSCFIRHRYKIALADGGGLYQTSPGVWKSKGKRQRVHAVRMADGESQQIQVRLLLESAEVASDSYNEPAKYAALQERLKKAPQNITLNTAGWAAQQHQLPAGGSSLAGHSGPGYVRSGHLFAANRAAAAGAERE